MDYRFTHTADLHRFVAAQKHILALHALHTHKPHSSLVPHDSVPVYNQALVTILLSAAQDTVYHKGSQNVNQIAELDYFKSRVDPQYSSFLVRAIIASGTTSFTTKKQCVEALCSLWGNKTASLLKEYGTGIGKHIQSTNADDWLDACDTYAKDPMSAYT